MRGRFAASLVLLAFVAASLGARPACAKLEPSDWKHAESEYARLYVPAPGKLGFEADKLALVALLLQDEQARSFRLLSDLLVGECTLWLDTQEKLKLTADKWAVTLQKPSKARTAPEEVEMFKAQAEIKVLEDAARLERTILDAVVKALAAAPPALKQNLFGRGKTSQDWLLRAAVAQVAAVAPTEKESAAFLSRTLNPAGEKDGRVRAAAVEALMALPEGAEEHVIGRVADPDVGVQLRAIEVVAAKKLTRAIPHLIGGLERASPRMQEPFGKALRELTGENFDPFADVWARWWEENKDKFDAAEAVKLGGKPRNPTQDPTLYGVPIKSDRVLFVIDISGSMDKESINKNAPPKPPTGPVTPKEGAPPPPPPAEEVISGKKIDVAKHELKKAIEKLPKSAKFAIIAFNHAAVVWKPAPVEASTENKEEAFKWIRQWGPSGSTFTDGALRLGFRMAGLVDVDKAYAEVVVDTILLVSDGAPTDNDPGTSKLMDYKIILQHVREWNVDKRVVINCIAVDMQPGNDFMSKLAAENGGVFVDR